CFDLEAIIRYKRLRLQGGCCFTLTSSRANFSLSDHCGTSPLRTGPLCASLPNNGDMSIVPHKGSSYNDLRTRGVPMTGWIAMVNPSNGTGIVLMNMGGPKTLDDVQSYLEELFSDRDIIQLPFQGI